MHVCCDNNLLPSLSPGVSVASLQSRGLEFWVLITCLGGGECLWSDKRMSHEGKAICSRKSLASRVPDPLINNVSELWDILNHFLSTKHCPTVFG